MEDMIYSLLSSRDFLCQESLGVKNHLGSFPGKFLQELTTAEHGNL